MKYSGKEQKELNTLTEDIVNGKGQKDPEKQVFDLVRLINYHDWRYYIQSDPVITDYDYDILYKHLKELEERYPEYIQANSPTHRVAQGLNDDFPTVDHLSPMLSLDNSYNLEDLESFNERLEKMLQGDQIKYCVEPKFDGSGISLLYENDILVRAATRGNGVSGEDITNNAKAMKSIPLVAKFSEYGIQRAEIRGEVVIEHENFKAINEWRKKENEVLVDAGKKPLELFKHSRNTAAGTLRNKNPQEIANRRLETFVYHLSFATDKSGNDLLGSTISSHYDSVELLGKLGFKIPTDEKTRCTTIKEVFDFIKSWEAKRDDYNYEIDGMVVKLDDYSNQQKAGHTAHHPRWAIAFKFKAKQAQTKLLDIDYQVGRTGAITPVAKLDPVNLTGVTISNVSLHNEDFISEKDIRINDTIIVERAGDVIPYIVGPVNGMRSGKEEKVQFISNCPSCSTKLIRPEDDAVWRCPNNLYCPAQQEEGLIHFVSKTALDIDGLGRDIIKRFKNDEETVTLNSIADIYRLDYSAILKLEGWKDRSVEKLRENIERSKEQPPWRLLVGLGIRHVGPTIAKLLLKHVKSDLLELSQKNVEQLADIEGIGPKVGESIYEFFHNELNIQLLNELKELGLNFTKEEVKADSSKLNGKSFLFTGSLSQMTRDQAKELVERNGGKNLSSVSANLNFLVAGEKAGSKLKKAEAIESVQVISEQDFLDLIV